MISNCNECMRRICLNILLFIAVIHATINGLVFTSAVLIKGCLYSKYEVFCAFYHYDPIVLPKYGDEESDEKNSDIKLYTSNSEESTSSGANSFFRESQHRDNTTIPIVSSRVPPTHSGESPSNPLSDGIVPTRFVSINVPALDTIPVEKVPRVVKYLWKENQYIDFVHRALFEFAYPKHPYKGKKGYTYISLSEAINKYKKNNSILLMLTDLGYLDQFWNTYLYGHFEKYKNLVVACINQEVYEILTDRGVQVAFIDTSSDQKTINTKDFTEQESPAFNTKLQWKLNIILAALECQVEVLYMDSDIFLLKDPFPHLTSYKGYDFVAQKDITICSGFMYLWPTHRSMRMLDVARKIRDKIKGGDQASIVMVIQNIQDIKYGLLPINMFMSGETFFSRYQYYWDRIDKNVYMYHNNYVRGRVYKEYRAKEMRSFMIERDNEYSSTTARYFTIQLLQSTKHEFYGTDEGIRNAIVASVRIANTLHRHFVVPPITCGLFGRSFCNLCYFEYTLCYNDVLSKVELPFKESIFFDDRRVPETIRQAFNQSVVYDFRSNCDGKAVRSTFPAYKGMVSNVICKPCPSNDIGECIIATFKDNIDPVIKVYSVL